MSSERKIIPELSDNSINLDNSKKNSEKNLVQIIRCQKIQKMRKIKF